MVGNRSPMPKTLPINERDPCGVPCSNQGSAAAAASCMCDTSLDSTTDFGLFLDDDSPNFPEWLLPKYSPNPSYYRPFGSESLKLIESLYKEELLNCQSSVSNCTSFATSCGGTTASASCNNSVSLQNRMNEEDPVDSFPHPLQQDENEELSYSYKQATINNDYTPRPDASVDPQNFSKSIEMDYNEETSQPASRPSLPAGGQSTSLELHNSHVKFKVKSFTVPDFFVEIPEAASVGFLKKAILEKATAMVGGGGLLDALRQGVNTWDENEIIPKADTSHQNKLDVILEPEYLLDLNGSGPKLSCIPLPPQPQTWCTRGSSIIHQGTADTSPDSFMSLLGMTCQDKHERLEFQANVPIANSIGSMTDACSKVNGSLDLVPKSQKVKAFECKKPLVMDENTLDVGPVHRKTNSSGNVKRREIKYFSILEVERLVKAVEELGTGSWAKIKEQAFGKDSRRTRTDLRDKWRTLLKTAETPFEKRRGSKFPPKLLDRVMAIKTRNSQRLDLRS